MVELGLKRATVYGIGFGSAVALELPALFPNVVESLVLQSVPLPSPDERLEMARKYALPIELKSEGSHWYATCLMLRDSLVFWPWYNTTSSDRLRRIDLSDGFDADHMHDWTVEVMKQYASCHHVINAALAQHALPLLRQVKRNLFLCTDRRHPFAVYEEAWVESQADAPRLQVTVNADAHVTQLVGLLGI